MNVEEAKRALMRREEDMAWMRLTQHFHRERGEVLRQQQRRQEDARRQHDEEIREAEAAFNAARAKQRREFEDADAAARAEERNAVTEARKEAREKQQRKRDEQEARRRAKEADAKEKEDRRAAKLAKSAERDRSSRRQTNERHHVLRSEYNRTHASTPHPLIATTSRSEDGGRPKAKTPGPVSRNFADQKDIEEAQEAAKAAERNLIEMRRLENLLARRQMEDKRKREEAEERERLQKIERKRAEELERERFEEQRRHVETVMAIEKSKKKRLTERVLVPLKKADGDTTYRTATASQLASSQALKSTHEHDADREARTKEADDERKAERKKHEELLALKTAANLEQQRKRHEKERKARDEAYKKQLEEARLAREHEEEEAKEAVKIIKAEQKRQEEAVVRKREERKRAATVAALEMKLESAKLADSIEARNLEVFREKMDEATRLTQNRRIARQLEHQQRREDQKRHEAVIAESIRVREEARKRQEEQRRRAIEDASLRQHKQAVDKDKYRKVAEEQKRQQAKSNEAFYSREATNRPKKPRVPVQPEASAQVQMPPHPELAAMETDAASRLATIDDELNAVDNRFRSLEHQRL